MASKLEKAQIEFEKLLGELGHRAEMVEMFDHADPTLVTNWVKAKEALEDRKLELGLLDSEIQRLGEERERHIHDLETEIAELEQSAKTTGLKMEAKKHKLAPARKKLAGAEYDLKFAERALEEVSKKKKRAEDIEDTAKVKEHEAIIKGMKIDLLKRHKQLDQLRREVEQYENPAKNLKGDVAEIQHRIKELKAELDAEKKSREDEILADLKRQRVEKVKDVQRSEQHLLDTLADVGEDLHEKRVPHSVLEKYYLDIDRVARLIDELQKPEGQG